MSSAGLDGVRVLLAGDLAEVGRSVRDVLAAEGAAVHVLAADLSDWDDVHRAVSDVASDADRIDVVVNTGPAFGSAGRFVDADRETISDTVGQHLGGFVAVTHAVLEVMAAQGRGRIINVVPETGMLAPGGRVASDSCAASVIALTANVDVEGPDHGVSAVAVSAPRGAGAADAVASAVAFLASSAGAGIHGGVVNVGQPIS